MSRLTRRDFLKLTALLAGGAALTSARPLMKYLQGDSSKPNVILILLDAMSASNLSLHGYVRQTTPNFEKFAERAIVYHNHHAASNFTTSGTASMLMGTHPWTHRAVSFRGLVKRSQLDLSLFALLGDGTRRLGFSQNPWVNLLLGQMSAHVDEYLSYRDFAQRVNQPFLAELFPNDYPTAYMAFEDYLGANDFNADPGSLTLGFFNLLAAQRAKNEKASKYPNGFPSNFYTHFVLDELLAGISASLADLAKARSPFFAYYHLLPPHTPYAPRRPFLGMYLKDGIIPTLKPSHPLSETRKDDRRLVRIRMAYDEYITNLDHDLGIFLAGLERSGLLDSSYVIITSDHGELFERGEHGHGTPLMYEPVTKIPLLVRAPAQTSRVNVEALTSNVDILPTLLSLGGREIPPSIEGRVLPELGGEADPERSVFSIYAKESNAFLPLSKAVATINKGGHKLIYYRGYGDFDDTFELFDLQADPEELTNLAADDAVTAKKLKDELLDTWADADRPYQRS
jgi:arylsulfatase A-like enzyme